MPSCETDISPRKICVFGLGYVGLTLATVFAESGLDVEGIEIRPDVVEKLRKGEAPFFEPGLPEALRHVVKLKRLHVYAEIPENSVSNVFIITVGTPLDPDGHVRLDMIERVANEIAAHLKPNDLVIARSTVLIGTTRKIIKSILDRTGVPYHLAFCPERTVEGQALKELRWLPQIVGAETAAARAHAAALFNVITPTVIQLKRFEEAEMVKLMDNTYRDVTFAFANEVARLCDASGIDVNSVIAAGKFGYPRTCIPMPGPVGGPCLEKDPHILAEGLRPYGIAPDIALTARRLNESQPEDIARRLKNQTEALPSWPQNPVISILGLAFKGRPVNDDLRGSMAFPLIKALRWHFPNAVLRGFDAVVKPKAITDAFSIDPKGEIDDALANANLVIVANNHPRFESLGWESRAALLSRPALIYDMWNHCRAEDLLLPEGVSYIGLGDGRLAV